MVTRFFLATSIWSLCIGRHIMYPHRGHASPVLITQSRPAAVTKVREQPQEHREAHQPDPPRPPISGGRPPPPQRLGQHKAVYDRELAAGVATCPSRSRPVPPPPGREAGCAGPALPPQRPARWGDARIPQSSLGSPFRLTHRRARCSQTSRLIAAYWCWGGGKDRAVPKDGRDHRKPHKAHVAEHDHKAQDARLLRRSAEQPWDKEGQRKGQGIADQRHRQDGAHLAQTGQRLTVITEARIMAGVVTLRTSADSPRFSSPSIHPRRLAALAHRHAKNRTTICPKICENSIRSSLCQGPFAPIRRTVFRYHAYGAGAA